MVKVIGLTREEKDRRTRFQDMRDIASKIFPEAEIMASSGLLAIRISKPFNNTLARAGTIYWSELHQDRLSVSHESVLEQGKRLAQVYEDKYKQEFTVKKDYE